MRRYLVVANQTLGGEHLIAHMRELVAEEPCHFHVCVPASHADGHATWTEGAANAVARRRLDAALVRFAALDPEVTGEVGDASPLEAIRDCIRADTYDGIVLSTLPSGASRWLRQDLPRRIEKSIPVPMVHVVSDPEPVVAS
jgi:hypothetical protein